MSHLIEPGPIYREHRQRAEREIDAADVMMLAELGPAQAGEEALGLIGAGAVIRESGPMLIRIRKVLRAGLAPCPSPSRSYRL
jgi:hypothetical protein